MISEGVWPSGAAVGMFSTVGPCAPIPFGSTDGEPVETLAGAGLVSTGGEKNHGLCAKADAGADSFGDGSAERGGSGIGVAILGTFVFPCANTGPVVSPGAAVSAGVWIAPSKALSVWFAELTEDRLLAICGGALGNASTGTGRGIGGKDTRNVTAGFDPAVGAFLVVPFAPGAFEGVAMVPVCRDELEGTDGVDVVD